MLVKSPKNETVTIKKDEPIYTKDGLLLGNAHVLYHRTKDINPLWEYYAIYLHVVSYGIGADCYVPTDFIAGRDGETNEIVLNLTIHEVENHCFNRLPDFIVQGAATKEELPR